MASQAEEAASSEPAAAEDAAVEDERLAAFYARASSERNRMNKETGKMVQKHQDLRTQFGEQRVQAWYDEHREFNTDAPAPAAQQQQQQPPESNSLLHVEQKKL